MGLVIGAGVFGSVLDNEFVMFENWVVGNEGRVDNGVIDVLAVFLGVEDVFVGVWVAGTTDENTFIFQTFFCECL